MKQYKHYSFDLWQTLIKSDPRFKQYRAEHFHDHFNRGKKTIDQIKLIFKEVDDLVDLINRVVGNNIDAFEMYTMVLHKLGYPMDDFSYRDIQGIYLLMEKLFLQYPATPFDDSTIPTLFELKHRRGCSISILSNTAFLRGSTLRMGLLKNDLHNLIDFQIYSDEINASKPSELPFLALINKTIGYRIHNPITMQDIIHVGDSLVADIAGANRIKMDSFHINSNSGKTIKDLL